MIHFSKYDANGNDFIVIYDPQKKFFGLVSENTKQLCQRNHGVGANGILLIHDHPEKDFELTILNSDGSEADMCANGARACLHFVKNRTGKNSLTFVTKGGEFCGTVKEQNVSLTMLSEIDYPKVDLATLDNYIFCYFLIVGVPHIVLGVDDIDKIDVANEGRRIRSLPLFKNGTNVNFIVNNPDLIKIRTFERGVEAETLSCGTGVMATAVALSKRSNQKKYIFETKGGRVEVLLGENQVTYSGPVTKVFEGTFEL